MISPKPRMKSRERVHFENENAEAIREARAEQRALAKKRKTSGIPDKFFIADQSEGVSVIFCRRGQRS